MTDKQSWTDRLFGGFRKTSEKLTSNLTEVVGTAKLDDGYRKPSSPARLSWISPKELRIV